MATLSTRTLREQESYAAKALGYPTGDVLYVDADNGNDANDGQSKAHAVATLVRALALASAGDTIVLAPCGSETLTATATVSLANLRIVCPVKNPQQGYELTGAGTVDLLTVSAADVTIEGLRFTRTAGAGSTTAGLLTTAGADRLCVRRCAFDYTALTSSWTNYGIEITDACDDVLVEECLFLDCHRGVLFATATATNCLRPKVKDCTFYVGQATAFGLHASPAGTGTAAGLVADGCLFVEADGDGSSATAAWNGTDNTDATRGPILAGAACDQMLGPRRRALTALAQAVENLNAVNAGAASDFADNVTGFGSDVSSEVASVGTIASSGLSAIQSYGTAGSTANSSGLSAAVSVGVIASSGLSATTSYGVAGSTANSSGLSATVSVGVVSSSGLSAIQSYGTAGSTANGSGLSAGVSYGAAGSTANSPSLSATVSWGTAGSTAHSTALVQIRAEGKPVSKVGSLADTAITNNTQAAGNTLCTASGDVLIEDVIVSKDGTALTGPTNLEVTSDNVYGDTGVNDVVALIAAATVAATTRIAASGTSTWSTLKLPMVLESTKKLYLHGDDAAGTSGGNTRYAVIGRALSAGGALT